MTVATGLRYAVRMRELAVALPVHLCRSQQTGLRQSQLLLPAVAAGLQRGMGCRSQPLPPIRWSTSLPPLAVRSQRHFHTLRQLLAAMFLSARHQHCPRRRCSG